MARRPDKQSEAKSFGASIKGKVRIAAHSKGFSDSHFYNPGFGTNPIPTFRSEN
jgi:hypothetical protein